MPVSSTQYGQVPWAYTNGFTIQNSATTPNTQFTVSAGSCLDSTKVYQISTDSTITVNAASNGLNGLDTGSLAASTVYYILAVGDPVSAQPTGFVISLSYSAPTLPFGYSVFNFIGCITTDASSHFLKGYWTAYNTGLRLFMYDAPQATAVTAGNATSYTDVSLGALVPSFGTSAAASTVFNTPNIINTAFTPGAASRTLSMKPANGTGDEVVITGQVTSVPVTSQSMVLKSDVSGVPKISYKVSNSGDAVAINVAGYWYFT